MYYINQQKGNCYLHTLVFFNILIIQSGCTIPSLFALIRTEVGGLWEHTQGSGSLKSD